MAEQENQQELLFKFSMFERQISELQQQIEAINKGITDLSVLNFGLDDLVGSEGKEIYAPLGKGIFVKAKLISEELNVDIGQGNFIKKNISDTKKLIEEQITKLGSIKKELEQDLEKIGEELTCLMNNTHQCNCEGNCNCGDECNCEKD